MLRTRLEDYFGSNMNTNSTVNILYCQQEHYRKLKYVLKLYTHIGLMLFLKILLLILVSAATVATWQDEYPFVPSFVCLINTLLLVL